MKIVNLLAVAFLGLLLTQCYPDGPDYVEEIDLTYTNYNTKTDFKSKKTYYMSDSILIINDDLLNGDPSIPLYVPTKSSRIIIESIKANMAANGWEFEENPILNKPDMFIYNSYTELTTTTISYYGGYYGGWYGGYYPYYGYGWYYPYPVTYSYTTGNLITNMVDPNDLNAIDQPTVVWLSIVNGLSDYSNFTTRVNNGVNQAFSQSPYLIIK